MIISVRLVDSRPICREHLPPFPEGQIEQNWHVMDKIDEGRENPHKNQRHHLHI
jgi:hypothetical protein